MVYNIVKLEITYLYLNIYIMKSPRELLECDKDFKRQCDEDLALILNNKSR